MNPHHISYIGSVVFAVDGKKKRKEKAQKVTQIQLFVGKPPWTDFYQILHVGRYTGHNHLCKIWCED